VEAEQREVALLALDRRAEPARAAVAKKGRALVAAVEPQRWEWEHWALGTQAAQFPLSVPADAHELSAPRLALAERVNPAHLVDWPCGLRYSILE